MRLRRGPKVQGGGRPGRPVNKNSIWEGAKADCEGRKVCTEGKEWSSADPFLKEKPSLRNAPAAAMTAPDLRQERQQRSNDMSSHDGMVTSPWVQ